MSMFRSILPLAALCLLGCEYERTQEPISQRHLRPPSPTSPDIFEELSPWPPEHAFEDEDARIFSAGEYWARDIWTYKLSNRAEFVDHDLRVRVIVQEREEELTLHEVGIERLAQDGFKECHLFRAPHELPRLLHLLSRAYDSCLTLDRRPGDEKNVIVELAGSKPDDNLTYIPTLPPPHKVRDKYAKVGDFTMDERRVRLFERVGHNVLFSDLQSARLFKEDGEQVYRVTSPAEITTVEDLLTVIRLFNAAYDHSMRHLRRVTPQTAASHRSSEAN